MRILLSLFLILTGCATSSVLNTQAKEWEPMGYIGFVETINKLQGDNSVNCGFYDITSNIGEPPSNRSAADKGFNCAREASRLDQSFKLGTKKLPVDSYAYEILVRTPESKYWLIVLDVMLGEDDETQLWVKRCSNIEFQKMSYKGTECERVSSEEWNQNTLESKE